MSSTLENFEPFRNQEEKELLVYSRYLEFLSSNLSEFPMPPSIYARSKDHHCFFLGSREIQSFLPKREKENIIARIQLDRAPKSILVYINFYNAVTNNNSISFSLSITPHYMKNIQNIEKYGRFKLLKDFLKNKEDILDIYFEAIRIFNFRSSYRNGILYSHNFVYRWTVAGQATKIVIPLTYRTPEENKITIKCNGFSSYLKKDELKEIKSVSNRKHILYQNMINTGSIARDKIGNVFGNL